MDYQEILNKLLTSLRSRKDVRAITSRISATRSIIGIDYMIPKGIQKWNTGGTLQGNDQFLQILQTGIFEPDKFTEARLREYEAKGLDAEFFVHLYALSNLDTWNTVLYKLLHYLSSFVNEELAYKVYDNYAHFEYNKGDAKGKLISLCTKMLKGYITSEQFVDPEEDRPMYYANIQLLTREVEQILLRLADKIHIKVADNLMKEIDGINAVLGVPELPEAPVPPSI